ncbi:hypothetical protein LTR78_008831 [Recurvomyces mirabilis]|uniref:Purple acid phosphatase N-terminal domain-containing protein n=1 Tax=Recurvomyces mirabilis TaxID=574656 RepID=A0AAE0TST4_9PEZI|nr:hypothetical protein LTR78_008831 [Recurvomyces mirabilis]KAK5160933.1 hypothetical protein LTS14_000726 [Recurvomyces mirabilis]
MSTLCLISIFVTTTLAVNYPPIPSVGISPVQQRIAINGPSSMTVGWNTYQKLAQPCVQYGTSSTNLSLQSCSSTSITFVSSRIFSNAVTLTGRMPATTYYYKIVPGNSTVDHFLSPRAAGDTTPFNMAVVVDLGEAALTDSLRTSGTLSRNLAQNADSYEVVVHPGDFAYADDWYLRLGKLLDGKLLMK